MIDNFRDEFDFLSNFYAASVWVGGKKYATAEHAYQAAKAVDPASQKMIRDAKTPGIAKKLGKSVTLVDGWESHKFEVMERVLRAKFTNPLLRAMLIATEDAKLIEGNTWGDTVWGVFKGKGENHLGRLLMKIREECKLEERVIE